MQASTEFAPQLDYRLRHVGGVPVLEEHSAAGGGDPAVGPAAGQAGAVTEINPVLPAERLATQCHQDAVLALASVEVRMQSEVWYCIRVRVTDRVRAMLGMWLDSQLVQWWHARRELASA